MALLHQSYPRHERGRHAAPLGRSCAVSRVLAVLMLGVVIGVTLLQAVLESPR